MKIINTEYNHPEYKMPYIETQTGWLFKKTHKYICHGIKLRIAGREAQWINLDTGKEINAWSDHLLYTKLNQTMLKTELEHKIVGGEDPEKFNPKLSIYS